MAKRFVVPFATSGDKSVTPDATDPAGAISYSQGWPVAYQLADTDPAYRPVGRQELNGVLFDVTGALAELQTLGFPEWVAVTGLVPPYPINAWVRRLNSVYFNTVANNSAAPESAGSNWVEVSTLSAGRLLKTTVITASGTFTPLPASTFFRVRALGGGGGVAGMLLTPANTAAFSSGGAAGGYSEGIFTKAQIGASISATIGLGGAAGTSTTSGGNGGTTTLGSLMTVPGGGGAPVSTAFATSFAYIFAGGTPGALPTGGSIANTKGAGGGFSFSTGTGATTGGPGASSQFGAGGYPLGSYVASPGSGYGAGAGGALKPPGVGATDGVAGQPGVIIIEEYV